MNYRLDNMIKKLRRDDITLPPHIKAGVMNAIHADGFSVKRKYAMRYAVGLAAFILISAGGTVLMAQETLPGDILYPVKRVSETAYVSVQPTPQAQVAVQEQLIDRRFNEVELVADFDGRTDLDFDSIENDLVNQATLASDAWVDAQERLFSKEIELASRH